MEHLDVKVSVPFPTSRQAQIAYKVLSIDSEPKKSEIGTTLTIEENTLDVEISRREARKLRMSLTSFFDSLTTVTQTLELFEPLEETCNH